MGSAPESAPPVALLVGGAGDPERTVRGRGLPVGYAATPPAPANPAAVLFHGQGVEELLLSPVALKQFKLVKIIILKKLFVKKKAQRLVYLQTQTNILTDKNYICKETINFRRLIDLDIRIIDLISGTNCFTYGDLIDLRSTDLRTENDIRMIDFLA